MTKIQIKRWCDNLTQERNQKKAPGNLKRIKSWTVTVGGYGVGGESA